MAEATLSKVKIQPLGDRVLVQPLEAKEVKKGVTKEEAEEIKEKLEKVGAKVEIYSVIGDMVRKGNAVLLASSDLDELVGLSDRIIVIREGRIAGHFDRPQFDKAEILEILIGNASDIVRRGTGGESESAGASSLSGVQ